MCGSLGNSRYTMITQSCPGPQPKLLGVGSCQDSKLRNGSNGRSGKLSHSCDEICACICSNVDLHVCVFGSAHCGCVVNGSVAMAAV